MDGYGMGWKLWPWPWAAPWIRLQKHLLGHGCETAEPKGWPIGLRTRGRFSTFEPAKSKERWMDGWMDGGGMGWKLWPWPWAAPWIRLHLLGHGCETAEPQQDSGPRGGPLVCGPGAVSAPSNQLKAKRWMGGWWWKLWPWMGWWVDVMGWWVEV